MAIRRVEPTVRSGGGSSAAGGMVAGTRRAIAIGNGVASYSRGRVVDGIIVTGAERVVQRRDAAADGSAVWRLCVVAAIEVGGAMGGPGADVVGRAAAGGGPVGAERGYNGRSGNAGPGSRAVDYAVGGDIAGRIAGVVGWAGEHLVHYFTGG